MAEKQIYPMIPEKSWWMIREQFKKTIPSNISVSYLKSLLSLTSDQAARNIMSPLRQMGLIDDDNKPTSRANDWRTDAEYSKLCKTLVDELYPDELRDLFPDSIVDNQRAKEWFMHTANLGESAASKVTSTFLLLKDGQVKNVSDFRKKAEKPSSKKTIKSNETTKNSSPVVIENTNPDEKQKGKITLKNTNSPTLHIDMQIHISPDASLEQIDAIFASMAKHLYNK